jgi:hypothetical protein
MDLEYRVCPVPVPHAGRILSSPLLKLSPKGEGFNPPNVGQSGIRHEDTVAVTENGCENLAPKWSGTPEEPAVV